MPNMASVVFLILAISSTNSHSMEMESWEACKKVIDQMAADRDHGGVGQALCVSRNGRIYSLQMALAARQGRR